MREVVIEYQLGTYSGTRTVIADDDDENERIIARMWRDLFRQSGGPMAGPCHKSARIISQRNLEA